MLGGGVKWRPAVFKVSVCQAFGDTTFDSERDFRIKGKLNERIAVMEVIIW